MFHMPLATSMEIASPADTARACIQAIENKHLISHKIFNLGGGERCRTTYKELLSGSFAIFGLGKLNFPEKAFAERNFHCGFYDDGDDLEKILHFQKDTLPDYYSSEKHKIKLWRKGLTYIFKIPLKRFLLKKSEPYHAFNTNNPEMIQHYFKP